MVLFDRDYHLVCASHYKDWGWGDAAINMRRLKLEKPIFLIIDTKTEPSRLLIEFADIAIRFTGENGLSVQILKNRIALSSEDLNV